MKPTELTSNSAINRGPAPGILASLYCILFIGGFVFNIVATHGASYPTPYEPVAKAQTYYQAYHSVERVYSFFIFWSSIPLGLYTANIIAALSHLKINRRGLGIATFGGYGASLMLALAGLCTWILSQPVITDYPGTTRVMQLLTFTTGGTGTVVLSGLLIAGTAVTGGMAKLLPKWLAWSGGTLGLISVLSMLNLMFPQLSILLPIGRFLGILWMVVAGFKLKIR